MLKVACHPGASVSLVDLRERHTINDLIDYFETLEFLDGR